jgi:hypothetical protein
MRVRLNYSIINKSLNQRTLEWYTYWFSLSSQNNSMIIYMNTSGIFDKYMTEPPGTLNLVPRRGLSNIYNI